MTAGGLSLLAARLFLADPDRPGPGPWSSLPESHQRPYLSMAQAATDFLAARADATQQAAAVEAANRLADRAWDDAWGQTEQESVSRDRKVVLAALAAPAREADPQPLSEGSDSTEVTEGSTDDPQPDAGVRERVLNVLADGPDTWEGYESRDTGWVFLAELVLDFTADLRAAVTPTAADESSTHGQAGEG